MEDETEDSNLEEEEGGTPGEGGPLAEALRLRPRTTMAAGRGVVLQEDVRTGRGLTSVLEIGRGATMLRRIRRG